MKALPKKRRHQIDRNLSIHISEANILKYKAIWYSSFIAVYIWFLYRMSYDFFVWHKPISEISAVNYVGAIAAIAFIWAGTKLWKHNQPETQNLRQTSLPQHAPQKSSQQALQAPQQHVFTNSKCHHYFGYLHQRRGSQEIPAECLTCEEVLQCLSSKK